MGRDRGSCVDQQKINDKSIQTPPGNTRKFNMQQTSDKYNSNSNHHHGSACLLAPGSPSSLESLELSLFLSDKRGRRLTLTIQYIFSAVHQVNILQVCGQYIFALLTHFSSIPRTIGSTIWTRYPTMVE